MRDYVITSLAMLKVGWDHDEKVYSDYFVPFIVDCLQQQSEGKAAVAAIKAALKDAFMLDVAAGVINTVLRRAADKHLVHVQHGVYELTEAGRQLPALEPKRRTFLRGFNQIVSELRDYLEREHNIEWDVPQSEEALLNHVNYHASPILAAAIDGKDLPSISKRSSRTNYLVGGFVQHISANSNPLFELLVDLVKGSVLANVLCYPSLEKICKRLDGLTAVHDTKVLIKALGYDGQASRDVAVELISALKGLGVQNTFFDTTKAELVAILRATEGSLRHRPRLTEAHHSVLRTFVASGYRPSDVMERIVSLGDDLERAGLAELRRPAHQKELTLDESRLEELFAQEMSGRGHYTDKHDIDAITAIHRLRGGKRAIDIESCRALFVTTNPALVRVAHDFHDEMLGDGGFPYAMLDHRLATIAWLKQPRSAASELPRHMLIASCLAAMNPPDELWQRHVQETDRLRQRGEISDGQFYNLMYSTEGTRALMRVTKGDVETYTDGTLSEIIEEARTNEVIALTNQVIAAGGEADAERSAHDATRKDLKDARSEAANMLPRVARRLAAAVTNTLLVAGILLIGWAALDPLVSTLNESLAPHHRHIPRPLGVTIVALFLLAVLSVANMACGATLLALRTRGHDWLAQRIDSGLQRLATPEGGESDVGTRT